MQKSLPERIQQVLKNLHDFPIDDAISGLKAFVANENEDRLERSQAEAVIGVLEAKEFVAALKNSLEVFKTNLEEWDWLIQKSFSDATILRLEV